MLTRAWGATDYASNPRESLMLDPIQGIFAKFKVPKPMMYQLYFGLTGDWQTARVAAQQNWSPTKLLQHIYESSTTLRLNTTRNRSAHHGYP